MQYPVRLTSEKIQWSVRGTRIPDAHRHSMTRGDAFHRVRFGSEDVHLIAERLVDVKPSTIGQISMLAKKADAVNLGQGVPSDTAPKRVTWGVLWDVAKGLLPYTSRPGSLMFRRLIAEKYSDFLQLSRPIDPIQEVTVTIGSSEALASSVFGLVNPGDEVVIPTPTYENFGQLVKLAGGKPVYVKLDPENDWRFDESEMTQAMSSGKVKMIMLCSPSNPTGKVFDEQELSFVADLCRKNNVIALSDETYQHMVYDDQPHVSIASLPGMQERSIVVSGLSKNYNAPGLRTGWTIAPPDITRGIRGIHSYFVNSAPYLSQMMGIRAMKLPPSYYDKLVSSYAERREMIVDILQDAGFKLYNKPAGAYYIVASVEAICKRMGFESADDLIRNYLIPGRGRSTGVAMIPGSAFFPDPEEARYMVRVSFCKDKATIREFGRRLDQLIV